MRAFLANPLPTLVVILALMGCARSPELRSPPTPIVPSELSALPRTARIKCYSYPRPSFDVEMAIWELPGITTKDRDSARGGDRGAQVGLLPYCTPITVTDYAWSEMDRQFWVLIQANGLKGWVWVSLVEFPPFSSPHPRRRSSTARRARQPRRSSDPDAPEHRARLVGGEAAPGTDEYDSSSTSPPRSE